MGTHPIFESDFDCLTDNIMLRLPTRRCLTRITKSQYIRAPADIVTTTVADVARYSEFVPFCTRSKMETGSMVGTLTVSYGPIKTTWSSDVAVSDAGSVMARNRGGDVVKTLDTGVVI